MIGEINDVVKICEESTRASIHEGTVAERASSRLNGTNDQSTLVHEGHEDDENAEIGVLQRCHENIQERYGKENPTFVQFL